MPTITNYGVGGYDESKPNNNVISIVDVVDDAASSPLEVLVAALAAAETIADVQAAAQAAIDAAP